MRKTSLWLCVPVVMAGCATSVRVKKLDDRTYALECEGAYDRCQNKAVNLCGGGDFEILAEDFAETKYKTYSSNPSGSGMMATDQVDVENRMTVRCAEK